jgi:GTP-binding protein
VGGSGAAAFLPVKSTAVGPPSGGNGGAGGNVLFTTSPHITSLISVPKRIRAANGANGSGSYRHGRNGVDTIVQLPVGTVIKEMHRETEEERLRRDEAAMQMDEETLLLERRARLFVKHPSGEIADDDYDEAERTLYKEGRLMMPTRDEIIPKRRKEQYTPIELDVSKPLESPVLMSTGGLGGLGNPHFYNANSPHRAPRLASRGLTPPIITLTLELKLLADVGLVGFPNAGKSTILRALTGRKAEVAGYQFTTLNPQVGVVRVMDDGTWKGGLAEGEVVEETWKEREAEANGSDSSEPRESRIDRGVEVVRFTMSDNPGLLPLASENYGLGHSFLRSIERSLALAYVLDLTRPNPEQDLMALRHELEAYKENLSRKGKLIILNKADEVDEETGRERKRAVLQAIADLPPDEQLEVVTVSGKYNLGLKRVVQKLAGYVIRAREEQKEESDALALAAPSVAKKASIPSERETILKVDPLNLKIGTSEHGLPLEPASLSQSILDPPTAEMSVETLRRMYKLAAISPPQEGSDEESQMLQGVSRLVGLMDQVKSVELEGGNDKKAIRRLLTTGTMEDEGDVFDAIDMADPEVQNSVNDSVSGTHLLKWTNPRREN